MKRTYEIDMCSGPLFGKILRFAVPLILSGVLQLLFNAADIIVVGRFTGSDALAAVGSTSSLINLLVNLFIGISVGANVMAARYYGSGSEKEMFQTVHTAILTALLGGCFMVFTGVLVARPVLELMGTPDEVLPQAVLYMRLYFIGMPAFMAYNFGAAILRAIGDTKRPLYFLSAAGVINVLFNLLFVVVFHMGVEGVAIATVISQVISAILVLRCLCKSEGIYRLEFRKLHIHKDKLVAMLKIGLPAGFQGMMFNISNVLIQSSVNSFGSLVMAGNTAASNIEGFVYIALNAIYQTSLSFTSQNVGARQYKRVDRVLGCCVLIVAVLGTVLGVGAYLMGEVLLRIYSSDPHVIAYGMSRLALISAPYALCGIMDVLAGSLRGMGCSITPMVTSLTGACLFRVIWIFTVFQWNHSRFMLYVSYPISWTLVLLMNAACYAVIRKKKFGPPAGIRI
ncbi:MAG: MATE family efflux transporter [Lachnospiraceae bacterium]|jgi:putative MATE family efflux protein|nr:MATE family efflux transporter [Lachnospiraceae bacterium]